MKIDFTEKYSSEVGKVMDVTAFIGSLFGVSTSFQDSSFYWQQECKDGKVNEGTIIELNLKGEEPVIDIFEGWYDKDDSVGTKVYTLMGYCAYHRIKCFLNEDCRV